MGAASTYFGVSLALNLGSFLPYWAGVLRRPLRRPWLVRITPAWLRRWLAGERDVPDRVSWWAWSGEYAVLLASSFARGARASLGIVIGEAFGCSVNAGLSVKYGTGGLEREPGDPVATIARKNWLLLVTVTGIVAALSVWPLLSPGPAVVLMVGVDAVAGLRTAFKTLRMGREPVASWVLYTASAAAALKSVPRGSAPVIWLYAASAIVIGSGVTIAWLAHRRRVAAPPRHRRQSVLGRRAIGAAGIIVALAVAAAASYRIAGLLQAPP